MRAKLISTLLLLLSGSSALFAQDKDEGIIDGVEFRGTMSWHPEDPLIGPGIGLRFKEAYRIGLQFLFRPSYAPRIYEEKGGKVQYQEKRYAGLLYLERSFSPSFMGGFHAVLGVSGGMALEKRRGFPERTLSHFAVVPRAGLGRRFGERLKLELEYRYSPQPALNGKEHRVGLRAMLEL